MLTDIEDRKAALKAFCERWGVREFSIFGSAVGRGLRPDSDIDILIDFVPGMQHTLFDLAEMHSELEQLLGRQIDLVTRNAVEADRNPLRRRSILATAQRLELS